jgi:hypothetical protein
MDHTSKYKIIVDHIANLEGDEFQRMCDRLCVILYPNDYSPVRAGGSKGDMKNDGYCPQARVFFAAHATRGEKIADTKQKICGDLSGCVKHHNDLKEWIFLTNDTLLGEVQTYVDETLRPQYGSIVIRTWDHSQITDKINALVDKDVEYVLGFSLSEASMTQDNINAPGGIQVSNQAQTINQYIGGVEKEERDFGILKEIIDYMIKTKAVQEDVEGMVPTDSLTKLREKVDKNFQGDQKVTVDEVVLRTWGRRNLVEKFVRMQSALDSDRVDALILKLQSDYRRLKGNIPSHQVAIGDYAILELIAKECIAPSKVSNPDYIANAVAVVLYFFELCNLGKK